MQTFQALLLPQSGAAASVETLHLTDLPAGNVLVQVKYSSLNYKDALAVTQTAPVVRSLPMIPGIDLAGTVIESDSPKFQAGDEVILTGWGIGERNWGGYSQVARVNADWLLPLPSGFTSRQSMIIGTAGLTAMLCVMALEQHNIFPDRGNILVTGATGGVGSIAIALLAKLGYPVTASSGRGEEFSDYLKTLGATQVIGRLEPIEPSLAKPQWLGAIDPVGGQTLATLLKQIAYGGCVTICGLAGGSELSTTVYPFILRGINLIGIDSVLCAPEQRSQAWQRMRSLLADATLNLLLEQVIAIEQVPRFSQALLSGQVHRRIVVDLNSQS